MERTRSPLDRRNHPRQSCEITLISRVGLQRATVTASDISATGARLLLPAQFAQAKEIVLSGPSLRRTGAVRAQIVWVRPHEDGRVLAGVHFLEKPSRVQSSWAALHLGVAPRRRVIQCHQEVPIRARGWAEAEIAELRQLESDSASFECTRHLHLGARFSLYLPYDSGHKQLIVHCQVVHRQRQGGHWRITAQFALNERARDRQILNRILSQMAKDDG